MLTMLYLNIHITYQAITKKKNYVVLDSILLRNKEFFVQSLNSEIIYFYLFQINWKINAKYFLIVNNFL